jgi:hypothetical protein
MLVLAVKPDYKNYAPTYAPLVRNRRMLELADFVVLCYDDRPNGGTAYVFRQAAKRKLPVLRVTPLPTPQKKLEGSWFDELRP